MIDKSKLRKYSASEIENSFELSTVEDFVKLSDVESLLATTTSTEPAKEPAALIVSGNVCEIGELQDEDEARGIVIQRTSGEWVTVKGLEIEEVKALGPFFMEDIIISFGTSPAPSAKQEPVAIYSGVEFSRYTIEWTNGPVPVGTKFFAAPSAKQEPTREQIIEASGNAILAGEKPGTIEYDVALVRNLLAAPSASASPAIPDVLFDGKAVYDEVMRIAPCKTRTSPENVSEVLDAVVSLMRAASPAAPEGSQQGWVSDVIRHLAQIPGNRANEDSGQLCITDDDLREALEIYAPSIQVAGSQHVPDDWRKAMRDLVRVLRGVECGDDSQWPFIANVCANADELLAAAAPAVPVPVEQDDLARDAARYRWLRHMVWDSTCFRNEGHMKIGEELDAAVDAAMASLQQGKEGGNRG